MKPLSMLWTVFESALVSKIPNVTPAAKATIEMIFKMAAQSGFEAAGNLTSQDYVRVLALMREEAKDIPLLAQNIIAAAVVPDLSKVPDAPTSA